MPPSSTLSLLIPLLLLLSLTTANVDETCKAAFASDYSIEYGFCATSLRSNPKSETASPKELGLIGAQLSLNNATGTSSKIQDMIKNGNYSDNAKDTLQDCWYGYKSQIDLLAGAVDQFNRGNYTDTLSRIHQVRTSAYDCGDLFGEGGAGDDPLFKDENDLDLLTTLALFLIARLKR